MTDAQILRKLARISPPEYAKKIERRNKSLLKRLEKREGRETFFGCPHCHGCDRCLWNEATNPHGWASGQCCFIKFGGHTLTETIMVKYGRDGEYISFANSGPKEISIARKFLKAHIKWAQRKDWGVEYKPAYTRG